MNVIKTFKGIIGYIWREKSKRDLHYTFFISHFGGNLSHLIAVAGQLESLLSTMA